MSMQVSWPSIYSHKGNLAPFFLTSYTLSVNHPTKCYLSTVCVLGTHKQLLPVDIQEFSFSSSPTHSLLPPMPSIWVWIEGYILQLPTVMCRWTACIVPLDFWNTTHFMPTSKKGEKIAWVIKFARPYKGGYGWPEMWPLFVKNLLKPPAHSCSKSRTMSNCHRYVSTLHQYSRVYTSVITHSIECV